jgi:metallo-beta-lactamase class B
MVARLTAGHTKGCTTWTLRVQDGRPYDVVISCSIGVNPGYVLVGNKDYPQIAEDYARSVRTMHGLPVDVFLAPHGAQYGLAEKYPQLEKKGSNPFIDPAGFKAYVDRSEKNFQTRLEEQQKAAGK